MHSLSTNTHSPTYKVLKLKCVGDVGIDCLNFLHSLFITLYWNDPNFKLEPNESPMLGVIKLIQSLVPLATCVWWLNLNHSLNQINVQYQFPTLNFKNILQKQTEKNIFYTNLIKRLMASGQRQVNTWKQYIAVSHQNVDQFVDAERNRRLQQLHHEDGDGTFHELPFNQQLKHYVEQLLMPKLILKVEQMTERLEMKLLATNKINGQCLGALESKKQSIPKYFDVHFDGESVPKKGNGAGMGLNSSSISNMAYNSVNGVNGSNGSGTIPMNRIITSSKTQNGSMTGINGVSVGGGLIPKMAPSQMNTATNPMSGVSLNSNPNPIPPPINGLDGLKALNSVKAVKSTMNPQIPSPAQPSILNALPQLNGLMSPKSPSKSLSANINGPNPFDANKSRSGSLVVPPRSPTKSPKSPRSAKSSKSGTPKIGTAINPVAGYEDPVVRTSIAKYEMLQHKAHIDRSLHNMQTQSKQSNQTNSKQMIQELIDKKIASNGTVEFIDNKTAAVSKAAYVSMSSQTEKGSKSDKLELKSLSGNIGIEGIDWYPKGINPPRAVQEAKEIQPATKKRKRNGDDDGDRSDDSDYQPNSRKKRRISPKNEDDKKDKKEKVVIRSCGPPMMRRKKSDKADDVRDGMEQKEESVTLPLSDEEEREGSEAAVTLTQDGKLKIDFTRKRVAKFVCCGICEKRLEGEILTINECLDSFCKSCLDGYFEECVKSSASPKCPACDASLGGGSIDSIRQRVCKEDRMKCSLADLIGRVQGVEM